MSNFVTVKWLYAHLEDKNVIIVDCRANLFDLNYGRKVYNEGHIKNAFFIDVKKDLAGEVREHGGRSPLPETEKLKDRLEGIGIGNDKIVVVYDEAKLAGAERFWWMMKYIGLDKVYVLDGGINSWIEEGYPLSTEIPEVEKGKLDIKINEEIKADIFQIKSKKDEEGFIIVDAREPERYRGEVEPIDKKAGHIPGAINLPWSKVLTEKGHFKSKDELKEYFKDLNNYKEIVLQCGSGIDACGNFVVLDELGFKPKLYVGSWSDWISYEDSPVAKGEE